jgi:hypothetical protein
MRLDRPNGVHAPVDNVDVAQPSACPWRGPLGRQLGDTAGYASKSMRQVDHFHDAEYAAVCADRTDAGPVRSEADRIDRLLLACRQWPL